MAVGGLLPWNRDLSPMRLIALPLAAVMTLAGCAKSPVAPTVSTNTLLLGTGPHFMTLGSTVGFSVSCPSCRPEKISNLRCESSNGDPVEIEFGFIDWDVYDWIVSLHALTPGATTLSCTADPNASGSTVATIARVTEVTMAYVRNGTPGAWQVDPTAWGTISVASDFWPENGFRRWTAYCSRDRLVWDPTSLTLTCRESARFGRTVLVDYVNAACVDDPARWTSGFTGGSIYINGTLLTTPWPGSTPGNHCMLFSVDAQGGVGPPRPRWSVGAASAEGAAGNRGGIVTGDTVLTAPLD